MNQLTANTQTQSHESFHAWLQLIRLPNLFTVPGDPLAGYLVACSICNSSAANMLRLDVVGVIVASVMIYIGGLMQNDLADLKQDRKERPNRPLASGKLQPITVFITSTTLLLASLLLISMISFKATAVAFVLIIAVTMYNFYCKRYAYAGSATMSLCRALNILLGASVIRFKVMLDPLLLVMAFMTFFYIFFVCLIAREETKSYSQGKLRWSPLACLLIFYAAFYLLIIPELGLRHTVEENIPVVTSVVIAIIACFRCWQNGKRLTTGTEPAIIQKTIGNFIIGLIFLQASFITINGITGLVTGFVILSFLFASNSLKKKFYCS